MLIGCSKGSCLCALSFVQTYGFYKQCDGVCGCVNIILLNDCAGKTIKQLPHFFLIKTIPSSLSLVNSWSIYDDYTLNSGSMVDIVKVLHSVYADPEELGLGAKSYEVGLCCRLQINRFAASSMLKISNSAKNNCLKFLCISGY